MSDASTPNPGPTPTGYHRTQGGGFKWQPPTAEHLSMLLPQYEIECILGHGGMGAVYKGKQKSLDRLVAIKILPPELDDEDASYVERFKNEAKVMAKFMHPAIVGVFDFGETSEGQLYIVMEYVDGTDVQKMIQSQGRLPPEHALAITAHVCDALRYAHEHGVIHRDIKPANILINMEGAVKVADFGLAKAEEAGASGLTKTGMAMGTPDYVAPEALVMGVNVDGRADLYAIGVMLYNMLTGNVPRGVFKPASVMLPGTDPRYDAIIAKAMQHDRDDRYQSAAEIRHDLDVILTTPMVQAGGPSSAAIPKAAVAHKPIAKGPQKPMGKSANVPVRQEAAAAAAPNHQSQIVNHKSKAPLFIGLGAVAAIAVGAFVMMGGKKDAGRAAGPPAAASGSSSSTSPNTALAGASAPPSSTPIKVREVPKAAASPSPSVSKSPPLPVSPSPDKFPPGQWVKVFATEQDAKGVVEQSNGDLKWVNGEFVGEGKGVTGAPGFSPSTNHAIRFRAKSIPGGRHDWQLRLRDSDDRFYSFGKDGPKLFGFYLEQRTAGSSISPARTLVKRATFDDPVSFEEMLPVEIAAVGNKLIARVNDRFLFTTDAEVVKKGKPALGIYGRIADIEVINLDGLSEAEALKILGVDEKGNDLRNPAAVAATAPAPAVSVSKSPPLSVSASSDKFPPGLWVKMFTKSEDLPADLRKPDSGVKFEEGWIIPSGKAVSLGSKQMLTTFLNGGIRARIRRTADSPSQIKIRYSPTRLEDMMCSMKQTGELRLSHQVRITANTKYLADVTPNPPIIEGDSFLLELAAVGAKCFLRLNGQLVATETTDLVEVGEPAVYGHQPIGDIEVINLDGLPEAEALRILGVDEKGNDLRALAAKQEQQKAEQAKVVDSMSAIPELKTLHEAFLKLTAERVTAPFEADMAKLNTGYLGGLDREIANEKKAGHLDGVIVLEAEKQLIADKQPIPAEDDAATNEALKKLRGIYRAAYAKIDAARAENLKTLTDPLDNRLKQLEATLTQQDRIAHAKTVREYREGLGKDGSAGTPARSSNSGGAAATKNEAEKSLRAPVAISKAPKTKPDPAKSRQAVEYALGKGCEVSIDHDGDIVPIKKLEDLPKSRWGLHRVKFPSPVTDEDLFAVTRAVELKEFVCNDRVGAGAFTSLAPLGNTSELKLLGLKRIDPEFSELDAQALLQSAEALKQITWENVRRSDALIEVMLACKNLDYLYLSATELTDDDMERLRSLPLLRSLNFRGSKLTDAGAIHLAKFKPLNRLLMADPLELGDTQLTQEGLATILKTHGGTLIQLNIGSQGSTHTDGMLRSIAADCSVLETLAMRGEASANALAGLSKLKKLKQLDFSRTIGKPMALSVAHCQAISGIKSLETLGVSDCGLTGEHVQALAGLKLLKTLHLNRSPGITDASVPFLLSFQELENLGLVNAGLTPAGVLKLTALKKLRTLTITGIDLTDAHIAQFKAALPGCSITR